VSADDSFLRAQDGTDTAGDVQTLAAAGLGTDGPALLEFFHERARLDADWDRFVILTRQLGDPAAEVRARAAAQLVCRGTAAIPMLRHAVNDLADTVIADRARRCLQAIEGPTAAGIPAAAARLLAVRKPAGAAEALLAYLPFADDQAVAD